jgi:regulator of RNase E activity RraA
MRRRESGIVLATVFGVLFLAGCAAPEREALTSDPVLKAFSTLPSASISDAVDQVAHKRAFLSHDVRPIYPVHLVGRAVTVLIRHVEALNLEERAAALPSAVAQAIDGAGPGQVLVVTVEDGAGYSGLDVAVIGGLSGTAAMLRGLAGAVIDGGVRDLQELRDLRFPVFTRSVVPASTVGRHTGISYNRTITCAGVTVQPGDIIVGDEDGGVVVPAAIGQDVLEVAREVDEREKKTIPLIRQFKSLSKAIEVYGRK